MDDDYRLFEKLWRGLSHFTETPTSRAANRMAFTSSDLASRQWLQNVWEELHIKTDIDGIGNVIGILGDPPYVLLSSHTDTVPQGGHYDGVLGVLAATVLASQWPEKNGLMLVDWSSEESSRFGISTLGSRLAVGEERAQYWDATDSQGHRLKDVVASTYGYPLKPFINLADYPITAAVELHIEQGSELFEAGVPIGVVTAIAAPQRWQLALKGQANHSAGTPMARRRDALAATAKVVSIVEEMSLEREGTGLRTTATQIRALPGAPNVIVGECQTTIDVRVQSAQVLAAYRTEFGDYVRDIATSRGLQAEIREISGEHPGTLDPRLLTISSETLTAQGIPHRPIASWPSHDSLPLSRHVPTAMLFVRNPSGVSHNPAESIEPDDIRTALQAYEAVVRAIYQAF